MKTKGAIYLTGLFVLWAAIGATAQGDPNEPDYPYPEEEPFYPEDQSGFYNDQGFEGIQDEGYNRSSNYDFNSTLQEVRGIMISRNNQGENFNPGVSKKLDVALQGFLNTPFMQQYNKIRLESESLVKTFKALHHNFSPKEIGRVRNSYNQIAVKFNSLLREIRNDFMDKKTMKTLANSPELYSNAMLFKLTTLKDEYSNNFERVVAEITGSQTYAAFPLGALLGLIKLTVDFTQYLAANNYALRRANQSQLNEGFMLPYSFKSWDDIQAGESGSAFNQNQGFNDNGLYQDQGQYQGGNDEFYQDNNGQGYYQNENNNYDNNNYQENQGNSDYNEPNQGYNNNNSNESYQQEQQRPTAQNNRTTTYSKNGEQTPANSDPKYGSSRLKDMNPFDENTSKQKNKKKKKN